MYFYDLDFLEKIYAYHVNIIKLHSNQELIEEI